MAWVHGTVTYRGRVVEVREMKVRTRTKDKPSLGWEARIDLGAVEVKTTKFHPTQQEAERALLDTLHPFTLEE